MWINELKEYANRNLAVIIVANKSDLNEQYFLY